MNAASIHEEVSKQIGGFMDIMRSQPLSLALVMMNVLLIAYLFYSQSQTLNQRKDALDQIVAWQRQTDTLMASCVSGDVMKLVINSLERDRELYRNLLPSFRQDGSTPQYVPPSVIKPDELKPPSSLQHLLPPEPRLQSDESRPYNLPPRSSGAGVPGQAGSPSGPPAEHPRPEQP